RPDGRRALAEPRSARRPRQAQRQKRRPAQPLPTATMRREPRLGETVSLPTRLTPCEITRRGLTAVKTSPQPGSHRPLWAKSLGFRRANAGVDRGGAMAYIRPPSLAGRRFHDAGWSSPVARQAHNLKVTSSNLVPATKERAVLSRAAFLLARLFCEWRDLELVRNEQAEI